MAGTFDTKTAACAPSRRLLDRVRRRLSLRDRCTRRLLLLSILAQAGLLPAGAQEQPYREVSVRAHLVNPRQLPFEPAFAEALRAPDGFQVNVFASGLGGPRMLAAGPDGRVYVTRRDSGDVLVLRDRDGDGRADEQAKVVTDLPQVHGITIHDGRLYLATIKGVYAADLREDGRVDDLERLVDDLPDGGQHPNRTLAVGPDGMLYVSIGSTCNACAEPNPEHATILRMRPDGTERAVFARGLRNTIGWGWHPQTGQMWGMDHGSDMRGDDVPPEELNRLEAGADYGWPFCWGDARVDSLTNANPKGTTKEAVVRIVFDEEGRPTGMEDFVTGFLTDDGRAFRARLAGVAVAQDGALLVSDDTNGAIYRIAYAGSR